MADYADLIRPCVLARSPKLLFWKLLEVSIYSTLYFIPIIHTMIAPIPHPEDGF